MAWRNIWRNRRRTFITAASILFAVLFASFMDALQRGAWDNMINNVVSYYFGYVQIHEKGYWQEQSIDKAFPLTDSLEQIGRAAGAEAVLPRLESFALAAAGETTSGGNGSGYSAGGGKPNDRPQKPPCGRHLPHRN